MTHPSKQRHLLPISTTTEHICTNDHHPSEISIDDEAGLYRLPNEVMTQIFNHLGGSQSTLYECTLASQRCYTFANPLLWKAPVFEDAVFLECLEDLECRVRNGQFIHTLNVTTFWEDDDLAGLLPYLPQLQHLTIISNTQKITTKSLRHLASPRLRRLHLHWVHPTKRAFLAMAQCPLEEFSWILSPIQPSQFFALLTPCPLRRLAIDFQFKQPHESVLPTLKTFHQLTSLHLSRVYHPLLVPLLSPPTVFPRLKHLSLSCCCYINTLLPFFKSHPQLEQVELDYMDTLNDTTLDAIACLPRVTHVRFTNNPHITSAAVRRLIHACPLTYLNVKWCINVIAADFPELDAVGVLDSCALDKVRHHQG